VNKSNAAYLIAALLIWWATPLLLTAGVPGYWAVVFIFLGQLIFYLSTPRRKDSVMLWLPITVLPLLLCCAIILFIGFDASLLFGSSVGPAGGWVNGVWVGAVLLGILGPAMLVAGCVAIPVLVVLLRSRPPVATFRLWSLSILNTALLYLASGYVLKTSQGEYYFNSMPKLVKITHVPPQTPEEKQTAAWLNRLSLAGQGVQFHMPIDFYGRAVDQEGKPLPGVQIKYTPTNGEPSSSEEHSVVSNADGSFHIGKLHGISLGVMAFKDGFIPFSNSPAMGMYNYVDYTRPDFYVADPDSPVIFQFKKLAPAEPMYSWIGHLPLMNSGAVSYLDPQTGQASTTSSDGALAISMKLVDTPAPPSDSPHSKFIPMVQLTFWFQNGGGFMNPTDAYSAPETGYQSSYSAPLEPPQRVQTWVVFKTPTGRYGSLHVSGSVKTSDRDFPEQPFIFFIDYNPSGSRTLTTEQSLRINSKTRAPDPVEN
jgi:hypothetical protein